MACKWLFAGSATLIAECFFRFLQASFHVDALRECMSTYSLEQTLQDFPSDIKGVYAMIWTRILKQPPEKVLLARDALAWVVHATRSLTIEEIRHAVASCTDTFKFDSSRLTPIEKLVDACCGLVTIEKESSLVRLVRKGFTPSSSSSPWLICLVFLRLFSQGRSSKPDSSGYTPSTEPTFCDLYGTAHRRWPPEDDPDFQRRV